MPNISEIELGGRMMVMLKGEFKVGKTVAAASWPKPLHIYDFDGRMAPLKLMYPTETGITFTTVGARSMPSRRIISFREFCKDFEELQDRCPYATVVLDSFTSLSNTAITYQLELSSQMGKKGEKIGRETAAGFRIPGFDEYNGETTMLSQILDICKILPCHLLVTAHPITKTETIDGKVKRTRQIASYGQKIASIAPAYFDEVYHLHARPGVSSGDGVQRLANTITDGEDFAGTALPLPAQMEYTNKRLFNVIRESLEQYHIRLQEKIAAQQAQAPTPTANTEEVKY